VVVHNLIDVEDEETLKARIDEVRYCYDPDNEGVNWKQVGMTVFVENKACNLVCYQTEETTHLFLVRHPKAILDNWRFVRNMASVEILKQILLSCNPRRFNLLKEFLAASETLLSRYQYLKGWDDSYCVKLKEENGIKVLLPFRKLSKTLSMGLGNNVVTPCYEDGDAVTDVDLNGLQITDIGEVITEGQTRLDGNVSTTTSEHIIQILVPGITDLKDFSFKFEGWHTISVSVILPALFPKSKIGETTTIPDFSRWELRGGNSFFRHTFPEAMPVKRPASTEELNAMITVEGGILTIHLARENLELVVNK